MLQPRVAQVKIHAYSCVQFVTNVKLWFTRDGSVPIRDQLATQLILAIASGELPRGSRLPSTRAFAKRYRLHANTVSAAYQQLESLGWVESVRGSGVYVRAEQRPTGERHLGELDRVVVPFLRAARSAGLSANAVRERINHWFEVRPKRFVFVHPDQALRAIIWQELRQAMTWPVEDCELDAAGIAQYIGNSVFLTLPSKHADLCSLVPAGSEVVALQVRHVDRELTEYLPLRPDVLVVIASGWSGFLEIARTVLTAAGCDPEGMVFRDSKTERWRSGLPATSVVVCDVLSSAGVPDGVHRIVFALVSDVTIATLKEYEQFFSD
jgi:GntR family transcriptional regulator